MAMEADKAIFDALLAPMVSPTIVVKETAALTEKDMFDPNDDFSDVPPIVMKSRFSE